VQHRLKNCSKRKSVQRMKCDKNEELTKEEQSCTTNEKQKVMKKTKKIKQEEAHNNIKTSGKSKEKQTFPM